MSVSVNAKKIVREVLFKSDIAVVMRSHRIEGIKLFQRKGDKMK